MHACMHASNILETRLLFFYFIFKCLFLFVFYAQISHASNQKSHQEFTVRCSLLFSASEISIWEDDRFWNTFFFFFDTNHLNDKAHVFCLSITASFSRHQCCQKQPATGQSLAGYFRLTLLFNLVRNFK